MSPHRPEVNPKPLKALVTGATSGIGRAAALQLARDGFEVIVHGREPSRGAQTVDEIKAAGRHGEVHSRRPWRSS